MIDTQSKKIHITVGDLQLDSLSGESILETMERAGMEARYNCREGFCGARRTQPVTGELQYKLHPRGFIDDDEILV